MAWVGWSQYLRVFLNSRLFRNLMYLLYFLWAVHEQLSFWTEANRQQQKRLSQKMRHASGHQWFFGMGLSPNYQLILLVMSLLWSFHQPDWPAPHFVIRHASHLQSLRWPLPASVSVQHFQVTLHCSRFASTGCKIWQRDFVSNTSTLLPK